MSVNNITGMVQDIRKEGKQIVVDGVSYGSYNIVECRKGDTVAFNYNEKEGTGKWAGRTFKNVAGPISVISSGGAAAAAPSPSSSTAKVGEPILSRDRLILRQNALTAAVNYVGQEDINPEEVIAVARQFEAYTSGDIDRENAEKAFQAMSTIES